MKKLIEEVEKIFRDKREVFMYGHENAQIRNLLDSLEKKVISTIEQNGKGS